MKKYQSDRKERRSSDTLLEDSTVDGVTSQVADLIGGALLDLAATHSHSGEFSGLPTHKHNDYN
jgi:hypothetical protein